jgi:hypothetical protein
VSVWECTMWWAGWRKEEDLKPRSFGGGESESVPSTCVPRRVKNGYVNEINKFSCTNSL